MPLLIYCLHLFSVACCSMHVVVRRHLTGVGSLPVGSRDWSQLFRLGSRHHYLLNHFTSPKFPLPRGSKLGNNTTHLIDPFKLVGNDILFQLSLVTVWKASRKRKTYPWIVSYKIRGYASVSRALIHTDLAVVTVVFFPLSTHAQTNFWCFTLRSVSLPTSLAFLDEKEVIREKHRAPLLHFPFEDKPNPSS